MIEYELWLDESGSFMIDDQMDNGKNPSIMGGVLFPQNALSDEEIRKLADPDGDRKNHAMEMSYSDAQRIVPAALEGVCKAGAKLVFFENAERIYHPHNRDLYLRVLASGLAQLVRFLSA